MTDRIANRDAIATSFRITSFLYVLIITACTAACGHEGDMVLALNDVQFFKAQEISTSPVTIRLSGLAFHSSLAVRNITTLQGSDSLQVLVHMAPAVSGMSGSFSYDLVVPASVDRVSFGEEKALIWDRSSGVVKPK